MFNAKYKPYQPVPNDDDSGDEIELHHRSNNKITDLLKLTAHRRIRSHSNSNANTFDNDTVIDIEHDHDNDHDINTRRGEPSFTHNDMDDVDLEDAHAESTEDDDDTLYDDYVFLLFLDGNKRKIGVMNNWRVWQLKEKYFKQELNDRKKIRLIYRGKLLQDAMDLNSFNIPSNGFIHVSISKNGNLYKSTTNGQFESNRDVNYENFDDGMDDEAIARRLQMELNQGQGEDGMPRNPWFGQSGMDAQEMDINRARREFFCGMFLGSVAGIWILIFLILANRQQYSRRFRMGVALGVMINVMIQLSYQYPNVNEDGSGDGADNAGETETPSAATGTDDVTTGEE